MLASDFERACALRAFSADENDRDRRPGLRAALGAIPQHPTSSGLGCERSSSRINRPGCGCTLSAAGDRFLWRAHCVSRRIVTLRERRSTVADRVFGGQPALPNVDPSRCTTPAADWYTKALLITTFARVIRVVLADHLRIRRLCQGVTVRIRDCDASVQIAGGNAIHRCGYA